MSVGSVIKSIGHVFGRIFSSNTLTAVEAWAAKAAPEFLADLIEFSNSLPDEFASLMKLAEKAKDLYEEAKGVKISTGLAVQLAQTVFTANKDDLEAEAAKLLKLHN